MKLIKASLPGWTKEFDNEYDLKADLYDHICDLCRAGDSEFDDPPVEANSSIDEMLWSPCGLEFYVEYEDESCD